MGNVSRPHPVDMGRLTYSLDSSLAHAQARLTLHPRPGIIATHRGVDRRRTQPNDHGLPTSVRSGGTAHAPLSRDHALLR